MPCTTIRKRRLSLSNGAAAVGIFAVALAVRLIYAAQARHCPLFQYPTIDAGVYYLMACEFAQGNWLHPQGQPYWQPPFYPAVLGIWMKIAGDSVAAAKNAQFVLGSVNCVLIFALGKRMFGFRVGVLAGLAAAFYAPLVYFDGELLTPTLQIFLNLVGLLLLIRAADRACLASFAGAGLVFGFSIIARPDAALFVIAASVWAAVILSDRAGRRVAAAAAFLICALLPVVPLAVRNRVVGRDWVAVSSNGGLNFYIGNNPRYNQMINVRPGPQWDALTAMPLRENPRAKPSEQSAYFYRKGFRYIRTQPVDWLKLTLQKSVNYLTAVEGRRNHDLYFIRRYSPLYAVLLFRIGTFAFPFGIVLPLAVLGMLRAARGREKSLLVTYAAAQFAATAAFFVVARYRVTVVPVLLVFAAYGATELWRMIRDRRFALRPLAVAGMFLVVSNANIFGVDRNRRLVDADSHYFVAGILDGDGRDEQAIPEYELAIRLNPRYYMSRFNYGRMLAEMGRYREAEKQLTAALALEPNSADANWQLGVVYEGQHLTQVARRHYESAVRLSPNYAEGLAQVAVRAFEQRDYAYTARAMRIVVSFRPDYPQARHTLGLALIKLGKLRDAVRQLRETCRQDPSSAESWFALGVAYHELGRKFDARAAFNRAIAIGPSELYGKRVRQYLAQGLPKS